MSYILTNNGKRKAEYYIGWMKGKKLEIYGGNRNAAFVKDDTDMPTVSSIQDDINSKALFDNGEYRGFFNVTRSMSAEEYDHPLVLYLGTDFVIDGSSAEKDIAVHRCLSGKKSYVYRFAIDIKSVGDEVVRVFKNPDDALMQLKRDVQSEFGIDWDDIYEDLDLRPEYGDILEPDYVLIHRATGTVSLWSVQEVWEEGVEKDFGTSSNPGRFPQRTIEEVLASRDEKNFVEGYVRVTMADIIYRDYEELLDLIAEKLVGSCLLMEIAYDVVAVEPDNILVLRVTGDVSAVISDDDE